MNGTNNSYPVKADKPKETTENTHVHERLSRLNIGQLLFLAFLFVMLLVQSINIYTNNSTDGLKSTDTVESAQENIGINFPIYDGDEKNSAVHSNTADGGVIYILGEIGGKLAVLSPDKKIVYEVFDVYISTLPSYDKELLTEGIRVRSTEELQSLVEDFSS